MPSPLADALSAKADALRDIFNEGERLFLFSHAVASNKGGDVLLGEVTAGWQKVRRRFERNPEAAPELLVFFDPTWTRATLETVRAFAILADGAAAGAKDLCRPAGVARYGDEIAMRLVSTGRAGTYTLPVADVNNFLLESGDALLLESGDQLLLEA